MAEETAPLAVALDGVTKKFGKITVLNEISWQVPCGHIVGLLGLNGSGKTTLLRLLMGIIRPSTGSAQVAQRNLLTNSPAIRQVVGYVAERTNLPGAFTASRMERVGMQGFPQWDPALYDASLQRFHIPRTKPVYLMNQGQRTLTALAFALAHHAEILLLDEPTNGLDPLVRRDFLANLIEESYDQGRTVILSSHRLEEVAHIAEDVAIIHHGQIVAAGAMETLLHNDHLVSLRVDSLSGGLSALPGARQVSGDGNQATVYGHDFDEAAVREALTEWGVTEWTHHEVTLDQLFYERVGDYVD